METYITRRDYLVWLTSKKDALLYCLTDISKIIKSENNSKLELIEKVMLDTITKVQEIEKDFKKSRGDIGIKVFPIKHSA